MQHVSYCLPIPVNVTNQTLSDTQAFPPEWELCVHVPTEHAIIFANHMNLGAYERRGS